jgi:holo-[acyl-carrier protein] synthase
MSRIQDVLQENRKSFLESICTENEIKRLNSEPRFNEKVSAVFALKEAFSKALGTGIGEKFSFSDLEVSYLASGQPLLTYKGPHKQISSMKISCSLSHEGDHLVAVVILVGDLP